MSAAWLTGWDIYLVIPKEFVSDIDVMEKVVREVEGVDSNIANQLIAMGMVNVVGVEEVGPEPLVRELGLKREVARRIAARCAKHAQKLRKQTKVRKSN